MLKAFASSLLSLLLLATFVWGGCISCEQYFMFGGAEGCCTPDGHCKTEQTPAKQAGRECTQIAFDHHKAIDQDVELPLIAVVKIGSSCVAQSLERRHGFSRVEPSPPDLQVLHSTFLI